MEGKYFYQATKSTLTQRKAVAISYLLYKAVNMREAMAGSLWGVRAVLGVTPPLFFNSRS